MNGQSVRREAHTSILGNHIPLVNEIWAVLPVWLTETGPALVHHRLIPPPLGLKIASVVRLLLRMVTPPEPRWRWPVGMPIGSHCASSPSLWKLTRLITGWENQGGWAVRKRKKKFYTSNNILKKSFFTEHDLCTTHAVISSLGLWKDGNVGMYMPRSHNLVSPYG